jgi:RNA polymerase sigma-70 factor (ECF subfamily)
MTRTRSADPRPETDLLSRIARTKDARAFEILYARHTQILFATAMRLTHDEHAAADAVHDAWVRAVERANQFEGRASVRTWLIGILVNVVREQRRADAREAPADHFVDASVAAPLDDLPVDPLDLDAAIAALSPGFRDVLVLHDVEGFTHEEIAEQLGIVPGTSKSQLARARQRLREMLASGIPRQVSRA